jgi:hypothetical protein
MLALGLRVGVTLAQRHLNESTSRQQLMWVNVVSPALRG